MTDDNDLNLLQDGNSMGNMSNQSMNDADGLGDVCRDFLRNVCRRGNVCRYRHPDSSEAEELGKKIEYIFCHDYQNRECRRQNCRFLHCTKQEEEIYRSTGKLPQHVLDKMAQNKAQEMAQATTDLVPVCKDFLKSECRRGAGRCKFRHISQADYEMELRGGGGSGGGGGSVGGGGQGGGIGQGQVTSGHIGNNHILGGGGGGGSGGGNGNSLGLGGVPGLGLGHQGLSLGSGGMGLVGGNALTGGLGGPASLGGARFPNQRPSLGIGSYNNDRGYETYAPPEPKRRAYDTGVNYGSAAFAFGADRASAVGLGGLAGALGNEFDYGAAAGSLGPSGAASALAPQSLYSSTRYLEDENTALRRRIDELKKQVADLMATNEFLLEQNAQLRTLGKAVSLPNVSQASVVVAASAPPPLGPPPLPPMTSELLNSVQRVGEMPVVSVSLATLSAQSGLPVSSIAAAAASLTSVMSTSTTPLVSYPIMTAAIQSLRPPTIPHSLSQL